MGGYTKAEKAEFRAGGDIRGFFCKTKRGRPPKRKDPPPAESPTEQRDALVVVVKKAKASKPSSKNPYKRLNYDDPNIAAELERLVNKSILQELVKKHMEPTDVSTSTTGASSY